MWGVGLHVAYHNEEYGPHDFQTLQIFLLNISRSYSVLHAHILCRFASRLSSSLTCPSLSFLSPPNLGTDSSLLTAAARRSEANMHTNSAHVPTILTPFFSLNLQHLIAQGLGQIKLEMSASEATNHAFHCPCCRRKHCDNCSIICMCEGEDSDDDEGSDDEHSDDC